MLHGHDLNHVQVWLLGGTMDGEHGIDDVGCELLGESIVELGGEGGASHRKKQLSVNSAFELELVEELGVYVRLA